MDLYVGDQSKNTCDGLGFANGVRRSRESADIQRYIFSSFRLAKEGLGARMLRMHILHVWGLRRSVRSDISIELLVLLIHAPSKPGD